MKVKKIYDVLIIGGGISSCVFASSYLRCKPRSKVALIEAGHSLGGRSSTRQSRRFKDWKLNHGSPNFNVINRTNNNLLKDFIEELSKNNLIKFDDSELKILDKRFRLEPLGNREFYYGERYRSLSSMRDLSSNIIKLNNLNNQIDFYFKTLVFNLEFERNLWTITSKNGDKFKSKFLVCSSNLILHKRSIEILNTKEIPLRKAIPKNKNKKIDSLLKTVNEQSYIPRVTFLIYTNNYSYKDKYSKKYRYFHFNEQIQDKWIFERVVFQMQENNELGIVIHLRNNDFIKSYIEEKEEEKFKELIISTFNYLFESNSCINQLNGNENFSIMRWRASQPIGVAIPSSMQFCDEYKIGFCGDWFDEEGFGRVEGAILSALKLSEKFKILN